MTARMSAPEDWPAVALLTIRGNRIGDGYEYREDGYVYAASGQRLRKWFGSINRDGHGHVRIWLPSVQPERLSRVERVLHRLEERQRHAWEELQNLRARGGVGHVLLHPHGETGVLQALAGERRSWREYTADLKPGGMGCVSWWFSWLEADPQPALEMELTRRIYESEQYCWYALARRLRVVEIVFGEMVQKKLDAVTGNLARIRINSRAYWYQKANGETWKRLDVAGEAVELEA